MLDLTEDNTITPEFILSQFATPIDYSADAESHDRTSIDELARLIHEGFTAEDVVKMRRLGTTMLDGSAGLPHLLTLVETLGGQLHEIPLDERPAVMAIRALSPEVIVQPMSAQSYWAERVNSALNQ